MQTDNQKDFDGSSKQAQAQLDLISSLLADTREVVHDNSFPFIAWGLAVPLCTLLTAVFVALQVPQYIPWVWGVGMIGTGFVVGFYYRGKGKRVKAQSSRILGVLWTSIYGAIISYWLFGMFSVEDLLFNHTMSILGVLLSIGILVTASLTRYKVLYVSGCAWMVGGFGCLFLPDYTSGYFIGLWTLLFIFFPGLIMWRKKPSDGTST